MSPFAEALHVFAFAVEIVFVDVGYVQHLLGREKLQLGQRLGGTGVLVSESADRLAGGKARLTRFEHGEPLLGRLVAGAGRALRLVGHLFDRLQVGQHQLGVDRFDVAQGVYGAVDVHDVSVFKTTHDVQPGAVAARSSLAPASLM